MRTRGLSVVLVLVLASWSGVAEAKLEVVATLPSLGSLARELGGDLVNVTTLASAAEDPHYVDPRPDYVLSLNKADLLIINGMDLEVGWLPSLQTAARNAKVLVGGEGYLDVSGFIDPLDVPTAKVDRSQGDIHPQGNPHYLHDPESAARAVTAMAERMASLDPANEESYLASGDKLVSRIEAFRREQRQRFAELSAEQRRIVCYHASMVYLNDWLGLEQVATIEPKPGISPDPGHVATVLKTMKSKGVKVLIQESYYPSSTSNKLAEKSGARVVLLSGGANDAKSERYLDYLGTFADNLFEALN